VGSLQAANVVTDWNTIASTTIVANGGKASVASGVWFAYTSIAVYDAVNAVHQTYQPFYYDGLAPAGASDEAASVAAAHRVLMHYFPAQQADLDAAYTKSLTGIVAPDRAKTDGVATGEAAAAALLGGWAGSQCALYAGEWAGRLAAHAARLPRRAHAVARPDAPFCHEACGPVPAGWAHATHE
jgi:hypothetical protein